VILFLTYHQVCAEAKPAKDREFYTVSRDTLAEHLQSLVTAGIPPLEPSRLASPKPAAGRQCFLSFDDGTADHYELVIPVLKQFNLPAVFFVPTAKLDRPGYLSRAGLRALAAAGHTIGCHSHVHQRMDAMNNHELGAQFQAACRIIQDETGRAPWIFAPPGGYINSAVKTAALQSGMGVIRTMRWGYNRKPDLTQLETIPINGRTGPAQFQRILEGRQPRHLYFAKEVIKAFVPTRVYERLRGSFFGPSGRN
jgi:peptidoglycan/xylan/chitin deacetylase (PgdA/CDA1 family)